MNLLLYTTESAEDDGTMTSLHCEQGSKVKTSIDTPLWYMRLCTDLSPKYAIKSM